MGLFGDMGPMKDQILDWPVRQVKITNHLHCVARSGAILHQGKLEDPDLLCHQGQDTREP